MDHEPRVFISYAQADKDAVAGMIQALAGQGVKARSDEGVAPGDNWVDEIENEIKSAEGFVVFVSPDFAESKSGLFELGVALARARSEHVPLIPVVLRDADIPFLRRRQSLDARTLGPEGVAAEIKRLLTSRSGTPAAASA
jgi:hypothetical protein